MNTLFPIDPVLPEGFEYLADFISIDEERELLKGIATLDLHVFNFHGYEAKRRVASFGYDWSFDTRTLSRGKDIPPLFTWLINRVAARLSLEAENIGELLVTEYPIGAVINWHRDAPPFDTIAGISLESDCNFRFRPYDTTKQGRNAVLSLPVRRRSLYIMQGPSRTDWEHSISPVKKQRYSITLRTLR